MVYMPLFKSRQGSEQAIAMRPVSIELTFFVVISSYAELPWFNII